MAKRSLVNDRKLCGGEEACRATDPRTGGGVEVSWATDPRTGGGEVASWATDPRTGGGEEACWTKHSTWDVVKLTLVPFTPWHVGV